MNDTKSEAEYQAFLGETKSRVLNMRIATASAVNSELIHLHWHIGRMICERADQIGATEAVLASLARDLQAAYPGRKSFTPHNLEQIRKFYLQYSCDALLQKLVAKASNQPSALQPTALVFSAATLVANESDSDLSPALLAFLAGVSWNHHLVILEAVTDSRARFFYIDNAGRYAWSVAMLKHQIAMQSHERSQEARAPQDSTAVNGMETREGSGPRKPCGGSQ